MQANRNKCKQTVVMCIVSGLALTLVAGGEPEEPVLESAAVSGGGIVLEDGTVMITGQTISGTISGGDFTISVGYVHVLNTEPANCVGDIDGDGIVGPADLAQLLGGWGPNPDHPADLNGDDVVNATDLAQLLGGWGSCP